MHLRHRHSAALVALVLQALAMVPAQAQTSDPTSTRQFEAGRSSDFDDWVWRAKQGLPLTEAEKAVQAVGDAVARKDCPGAVAALNAGLAKGHADVMVLAGAMFEHGICVKANWDRAVTLYQRGLTAGQPTAAARLAAGFASAAGGADKAAALWWASQAKTPQTPDCATSPTGDDPDKFVALLKSWPAARLDACFYVAAVMASLQAEAAQPNLASRFGLAGSVTLAFVPAEKRMELLSDLADDTATGRVGQGAADELAQRRKAFDAHLQAVAQRAIARYALPGATPPDWPRWRVPARFAYQASR